MEDDPPPAEPKVESEIPEEKCGEDTNDGEQKTGFPKKNAQYCGTGRLPCPDLGKDWEFEQIVRQQGKSAGNYDTYYFSPKGDRIRSKLKLQSYVEKDLKDFDFNAGEFVKDNEKVSETGNSRTATKKRSLKKNHLKTVQPPAVSVKRKKESAPSTKKNRLICRFAPLQKRSKKSKSKRVQEAETPGEPVS